MKRIFIIILAVFLSAGAFGKMTESSLSFKNLSVDEGLPHSTVSTFHKDRKGFLWIGTKEGLARFDGNHLVNFQSFIPDDIWSIKSLKGDTLLLTTVAGVKWLDTKTLTRGHIEGAPRIWFSSLCQMDSSSVLAGSEQGLYLIRNKAAVRIPIGNMLANSNHVTGIIADVGSDGFWFSTADGVGYIDSQLKPVIYRRDSAGSRDNYYTCLTEANGEIYLGSYNNGVFRFDKETHSFTHVDTSNANLIMRLDADDGHLYVGTNGRGLLTIGLDNGDIQYSVHKSSNHHSLASNVVTALMNDENGIYIGTQFGGLSYHAKAQSRFSFYRTPHFNSMEYSARSIYFYPDGEMLLGTRSGIFQLKDGKLVNSIETTDFNSNLSSGIILYIGEAHGKILVCSYGGGVKVYDRKTGRLSPFNDNEEYARNGRIFHFVLDREGHIWFASHEGLYETDEKGNLLRHISSTNSIMRNDATYWLAFDKVDRLWIASKFGLQLLDPPTGKMEGGMPFLPSEIDVRYIYRDSNDDMWVCTNRGVYCINDKLELIRLLNDENILPENNVSSVVEMPRDVIRIATIHNIVSYSLSDGESEVFRRNDGLGPGDFNGNVAVNPLDGNIYWTNEAGLLHTSQPMQPDEPSFQIPPRITYVQTDDSINYLLGDIPEKIELTEGESVQLNLSHMDFRYPENENFEYILEGKDAEWKLLSGESEVSYHALPPGEYVFKARTPGMNEAISTVIEVRRHTWKILLFWLCIVLLGIIIAVLVYWIKRLYRRIAERTQMFSVLNKNSRKTETESAESSQEEQSLNPLISKLLTLVENQKIYLDPKLKLSAVAGMLGCKDSELSHMLNTELSSNFTTFINSYRVKAIKKAMADGELKRYTITAIGLRYGYNSKMTFFRAFKVIEGKTPLEYCKEMKFGTESEE